MVEVGEFDQSLGIGRFHFNSELGMLNAECRNASLGLAFIPHSSFRIQHSLYLWNWNFQSVISKHHAVGKFAVDFSGKAHTVAAMREPGPLRPHPSGNFNRLIQSEMRIMLFLLQSLNNQIFNTLQFLNRFLRNLAQVGDIGKVTNTESITSQGIMLQ